MGALNGHTGRLMINGKRVRNIKNEATGKIAKFDIPHINDLTINHYGDSIDDGLIYNQRLILTNQDDDPDWEGANYYDRTSPNYSSHWITRNKAVGGNWGEHPSDVFAEHWSRYVIIRNYKKYRKIILEPTIAAAHNYIDGQTYNSNILDFQYNVFLNNRNPVINTTPTFIPDEGGGTAGRGRLDHLRIEINPQSDTITSVRNGNEVDDYASNPQKWFPRNPSAPAWWDNGGNAFPNNTMYLQYTVLWFYVSYWYNNTAQQQYGIWMKTKRMIMNHNGDPANNSSNFMEYTFSGADPDNDLVVGILPLYNNVSGEQGINIIGQFKVTCIE